MFESLANFTVFFSNSEELESKVEAFEVVLNEVSDSLNVIQFAQMRGLHNRLVRLLNVTVTLSNTSSDNEDKWLIDWNNFVNKLE